MSLECCGLGHNELYLKEMGDVLAKSAVNVPVARISPALKVFIGAIFKRQMMLHEFIPPTLTNSLEFQRLINSWDSRICRTRAIEVGIARLFCRIPYLNLYLHRAGLGSSPNRSFRGFHENRTFSHFFEAMHISVK